MPLCFIYVHSRIKSFHLRKVTVLTLSFSARLNSRRNPCSHWYHFAFWNAFLCNQQCWISRISASLTSACINLAETSGVLMEREMPPSSDSSGSLLCRVLVLKTILTGTWGAWSVWACRKVLHLVLIQSKSIKKSVELMLSTSEIP